MLQGIKSEMPLAHRLVLAVMKQTRASKRWLVAVTFDCRLCSCVQTPCSVRLAEAQRLLNAITARGGGIRVESILPEYNTRRDPVSVCLCSSVATEPFGLYTVIVCCCLVVSELYHCECASLLSSVPFPVYFMSRCFWVNLCAIGPVT